MNKIILMLAALLGFNGIWAQAPSWKDSVGVKKVLDARFADEVIYFQLKKGWGVYDRNAKKIVITPQYQFVKRMNDGYYVVQNNKVGFVSNEGKVIEPSVYSRLGQLVQVERRMVVKNNLLYYENEKEPLGSYNMLGDYTESSVAVHDGKVFVNQYVRMPQVPYQHVTPEGETWDSLDANGQLVYMQTVPDNISGIYNLADHAALPGFTGMSKVGFCKNNLLAKKHTRSTEGVLPIYYIQDARTGKIHTIKDEKLIHSERKTISLVLSDYNTKFLYCADSTQFNNFYLFESEGKYGLYDPYGMRVCLDPVYDFVHLPMGSEKPYTVKNGKVGVVNINTGQQVYDNIYESLGFHIIRHEDFIGPLIECDGHAYEMDKTFPEPGPLPPKDMIDVHIHRQHYFNGLKMVNGKAVVHDYTPPYDEMMLDPDMPEMEPIVVIHPARSFGGVFDPAARKWIVKPKYSLISAAPEGYACKEPCVKSETLDCFTYAYFTPDGKTVFEKKAIDTLWKDEQMFARLAHTGQTKTTVKRVPNNFSENIAIVSTNGKYGVYNADQLKWKVEPVHEMVDHNTLSAYYTVVDSGRLGLLDYNYQPLVPSLYKKVDLLFQHNLLCANDTFLYSRDSMRMVGRVDTFKHAQFYYDQNLYAKLFLTIELESKKIVASEELYDPETTRFTPEGEELTYVTDSSGTHITDLATGTRISFAKGWNLREWDKGFLTRDADHVFWAYDAGGKPTLNIRGKDSAGCSQQWLVYMDIDDEFAYDPKGDIIKATSEDRLYLSNTYTPVGYGYHYSDGTGFIEGPQGFRVLCANQAGLLLGYEIQPDPRTGKLAKRYRYYDAGTRQYSDVDLELGQSAIRVFAVKDGFVLFDHNRVERLYTCTVLENDLRTVKSTFKKLTGYKASRPYAGVNPIPYYELYTDKKIMYFDRDFQFVHECNYQDRLQYGLGYNRIFLKSKFKTLVMDWKGRLIRQ